MTQVQSLDWEDPLEKEMATHSSILAWEIPWTEEPGGLTVQGVAEESDTTKHLSNNNPLAYCNLLGAMYVSLVASAPFGTLWAWA